MIKGSGLTQNELLRLDLVQIQEIILSITLIVILTLGCAFRFIENMKIVVNSFESRH